jgi:predicted ATPase
MTVVTFLFTDIEGSTRRWEADADAMRVAVENHNRILREAIEAHDGGVFNYTGDGMCAVFASPRSAVDAAITAQLALELRVRMGICTGEAELRGGEYFGTVLNRTSRVMAAGHGGQILLDGATAGLLSGIDLVALGYKHLRDIARPVELFQVQAAGLRSDFPPLKTVDSALGNLRPRNTTFIGRETELADLADLLKAHQLVTLTGVGGVGKTRLALEVGARLFGSFPDGVWVIELAAVGDPAAVPEAVAAVLGITQQPQLTLADSVAAALEGRSRLLILDNCEHVLDAAADMIEAILARSETVKILATSREGLRIEDEQLWTVPSLDTNAGLDSSAASLFFDRAHAVTHGVSLTGPHDAVVEICQRLDGIPLAIELAASRMQSMSVAEVRDRLDDRFRLLVGSRRGLERHQTLRHAVQWSYELLDDAEKLLLTSCSVFAGGYDLAAACAITDSTDEFATLDLLDALVRKSLLVADRSSGSTRFSMLETVRQFAEEQLVNSGKADEARAAHARYFAGLETEVMAVWDSPRQREAYEWFNVELANLRAAFRWAADRGDLDTATTIAFYAALLGVLSEQYEPVSWAEELIESANAVNHKRLVQLYVMAAQCYMNGRVDDAVRYIEAGRAAMERGCFDDIPFGFEAGMYAAYNMAGHPETAVANLRDTIARSSRAHLLARACLVLSLANAGAVDDARAATKGLLADVDISNNPNAKALALFAHGWAYRDFEPAMAYDVNLRALKIAQDSGSRFVESSVAINLARGAFARAKPMDAFDYLVLVIRRYHDSGSFMLMHGPLAQLAAFLDQLGHHEPAATIMGFADMLISRLSFPEVKAAIAHLREVLGDGTYDSLARVGANMTNTAIATYAFDQIDLARANLLDENESQ